MILETSLYYHQIPVELRQIIRKYYIAPLDNLSIHGAVKRWCLYPHTHINFRQLPPSPSYTFLRYGHISEWDTSHVTNCYLLFHNQILFNESIEHWDVRRVTNMSGMFTGAKYFNQPLNRWNISSVMDLHSMFAQAESFNQPLDQWDASRVVHMNYMFKDAISFNQPLQTWNVQRVQSMSNMFCNAKSFNQPLARTWRIEKVKDMSWMFYDATSYFQSLEEWDLNRIVITKSVRKGCMFNGHTLAGCYQWWLNSRKKLFAWIQPSCIICIVVVLLSIIWYY